MIKEVSYGIVPFRQGKVLLLRVYDTWDFPKGKPDAGELPFETATRELREETSLENPVLIWGDSFCETAPYKRGKKVAKYFLAECSNGEVKLLPNPQTGIVEHHDFMWLTFEEARLRVKPRLHPIVDWAQARIENDKLEKESSVQDCCRADSTTPSS